MNRITAKIMPFIAMGIMLVVFVLSLVFFSYIFITAALLGLILFAVGYVRGKWMMHKFKKEVKKQPPSSSTTGRVIEHDEIH